MLEELANLICKDHLSILELEKKYPPRNLEPQGMVTRFAPSPTGFLHTGSLFTALINYKLAKDSKGIFYLRIEDTDTLRKVSGSEESLKEQLKAFGITFNNDETYAPYKQSERKLIYDTVLYELILKGRAYPAFETEEELKELKEEQLKNNLKTGYYGKFALSRNKTLEEAIKLIKENKPYVVRFKSLKESFKYEDLLRGELKLEPNDLDIVLRKSDGLPTYHFAHVCDDHFMRTTHVIRGEEWIMSLPLHYELFNACGFKTPNYLHLPTIMKNEDGKRRKLSKRKDLEASVSFLLEAGYPKAAIIKYLLTLANSNFEPWLINNPETSLDEFKLSLKNFSLDGALFDLDKLKSISKEVIANFSTDELMEELKTYASKNDEELNTYLTQDETYFKKIISIGRNTPNKRKDYVKYAEIKEKIGFFYNDYFKALNYEEANYPQEVKKAVIEAFLTVKKDLNEEEWLTKLKELSLELGFAKNKKAMEKENKKYMFSDFMNIIRLALTKSKNSPNLYDVINILKDEDIRLRLSDYLNL